MPNYLVFGWLQVAPVAIRHTGATSIFVVMVLAALAVGIKLARSSSGVDISSGEVEAAAVLYCPKCGQREPGSSFCPACGFQLVGTPQGETAVNT
jgi:hypothetical protein